MVETRQQGIKPLFAGARVSGPAWFIGLLLLGLALRLPGLLVNGMLDLDEIMLVWGAEVRMYGLAAAFKNNYGLFSYALYGVFFAIAEHMPRFWWLPYKLAEIYFEALILVALYVLSPVRWRWMTLLLYWLNPWFILHGAWQGFWEGPHTLAALLAVLTLRRLTDERVAWFLVGALLMTSAMFKPQGLAYFVVPMVLYLGIQLVRAWHPGLVWFTAGVSSIVVASTVWLVLLGGRVTALLDNYLSAVRVMPHLCNGCVSIWRTVAVLLQGPFNLSGPTYALEFPAWLETPLHGLAALLSLVLLVLVALRLPLTPQQPFGFRDPAVRNVLTGVIARLIETLQRLLAWVFRPPLAVATQDAPPYRVLLLVLALASLIVSQFGTRAHINHTYTALVLLIPLIVNQGRLLAVWIIMIGIQFYAHLAIYRIGRPAVLPEFLRDPAPVQPLVESINAALATQPYQHLLQLQDRLNHIIMGRLPEEPIISILAFVHFVCAVYVIWRLLNKRGLKSLVGSF